MLWTENIAHGLKVIRHQHRLLVVPLIFMVNLDFLKTNYKKLLLTFIITTSVAASFTILLALLPENTTIYIVEHFPLLQKYPKNMDRVSFGMYSPFVDRLQFSNLIGITSITLFFLLLTKNLRKGYFLLFIPLIYCSIILGGRGGQLALFFAFATYSIILSYKYFISKLSAKFGKIGGNFILISTFLLLFTLTPYTLFKTNSHLKARYGQMVWELTIFENDGYKNYDYVHFTSVRRFVSWGHLWSVFQENPVIGVGTGDVLDELAIKYNQDDYVFPVNIHSQYLYILAGWGLLGGVIFFGSWFFWLNSLTKNTDLFYFGIVFTIFSLVSMFTDAILIKQVDLMAFIVFMVLIPILSKESIQEKNILINKFL